MMPYSMSTLNIFTLHLGGNAIGLFKECTALKFILQWDFLALKKKTEGWDYDRVMQWENYTMENSIYCICMPFYMFSVSYIFTNLKGGHKCSLSSSFHKIGSVGTFKASYTVGRISCSMITILILTRKNVTAVQGQNMAHLSHCLCEWSWQTDRLCDYCIPQGHGLRKLVYSIVTHSRTHTHGHTAAESWWIQIHHTTSLKIPSFLQLPLPL